MNNIMGNIVHGIKKMMANDDAIPWIELFMDIHRYYMENWNFWRDNIGFCLGK